MYQFGSTERLLVPALGAHAHAYGQAANTEAGFDLGIVGRELVIEGPEERVVFYATMKIEAYEGLRLIDRQNFFAARKRQIIDIQSEIDVYERMLRKSREQQVLIQQTDVTRKNSVNRILIENAVVSSLKSSGRPRNTRSLYRDAVLIVGTLKEGTFRTILHRMKNRGIITSVSDGKWQIAAPSLIRLAAAAKP